MSERINILFPTGRCVWTSGNTFYDGATEDYDGNPLVYKEGTRKGQPRIQFAFGYAIAKTPGPAAAITLSTALVSQGHTLESLRAQGWTDAALLQAGHATALPAWAIEPWGKQIYAIGTGAFRNGETMRSDFSWKIADGDSAVPGKAYRGKPGRANKDKEGYPGCWVLTFSSDFAPKVVDSTGEKQLQGEVVKCGHYIQVYGNVLANSGASPGVYLNHDTIAYRAWGEEIRSGVDPRTVGFGKDALPAGASIIPQGGSVPLITGLLPPTAPGGPTVASAAGVVLPSLLPPTAPGGALPFVTPATVVLPAPASSIASSATISPSNIIPHPGILTLPVPGAAAPLPPAPPAGPVMSPAAVAAGYTYAAFKAANWTDAQMRQAGHLI